MTLNRNTAILMAMLALLTIGHATASAEDAKSLSPEPAKFSMSIITAVKQGSGYNRTELDGTNYYFSSIGTYDLQESSVTGESNWGTMAFSITPSANIAAAGSLYSSDSGSKEFSDNGTFDIDGNGVVALDIGLGLQTDPGKGYLSANRQYMAIRHATTWTTPPESTMLKVGFGIKRSGTFVAEDLNGTFHLRNMEIYGIGTADRRVCIVSGTMEITMPTYTANYTNTWSDGSSKTHTYDGTIAMNADGSFSLHPGGGSNAFQCQLSGEKNVFVVGLGMNHASAGTLNGMAVGIRASGNEHTNADLSGTYQYSDLLLFNTEAATDADRKGTASWGAITFDGNGEFTYTVTRMLPDAATSSDTGKGNYTMNSNGDFQLTITERSGVKVNSEFAGHMSGDGEMLVLTRAQAVTSTEPPVTPENTDSGGSGGGGCFLNSMD